MILPHHPKPASLQSTAAAAVEASLGCGDGEAEVASPSNGRASADSSPNVLCAGSMSGAVLWRFLRGWFCMRPTPRWKELESRLQGALLDVNCMSAVRRMVRLGSVLRVETLLKDFMLSLQASGWRPRAAAAAAAPASASASWRQGSTRCTCMTSAWCQRTTAAAAAGNRRPALQAFPHTPCTCSCSEGL